jgi:hypothetical protein
MRRADVNLDSAKQSMHRSWRHRLALAATALAAAAAGCAQPQSASTSPEQASAMGMYTGTYAAAGSRVAVAAPNAASPDDPTVIPPRFVHLYVYQINVPMGAVSDNEKFWRHVDEQVVDVATHDLLYKNGIRVGETAMTRWAELRHCITAGPSSFKRSEVSGADAVNDELEVSEPIDFQYIFYFDASNHLIGRSYDRCRNILGLSFIPDARENDAVRVSLCPIVRAQRTVMQFTAMNSEQEITMVRPERLYDLNLTARLPADQILIVAPSPRASFDDCVGNRFFINNGPTEKTEMVLLMVARPVALDQADAALVGK